MAAAGDSALIVNDAIAGLLLLARAFPQRLVAQRERRWLQLRREQAPADVEGQTVLIVGDDEVGASVAHFAQALAMRVIVEPLDQTPAGLAEQLPQVQWVVLACAQAAPVRHLLDARALARLPRGAGVINVVSDGLIDEAALLAALDSGHVGSAYFAGATSVIAIDSPLRKHPRVICSSN